MCQHNYYDVPIIALLYCTLPNFCVVVHVVIVYLHCSDLPLNEQLWWAAHDGHTEEVVRLLGEGANPNWQDVDGWAAVHVACYYNHPQMLTVLISKHANINNKDNKDTPLHYACMRGNLECVSLLMRAACDSG